MANGWDWVRRIDASGIITTFAGTGERGFSGDGGPATEAQLNRPIAVATDGLGNVLVADKGNYRVRKIDPSGVITTFAGNGEPDFSESSGKALDVVIDNPHGVAALPLGDVLFADRFQVWKLDSSGAMSVFAGSGRYGYSGDGGSALQARMKWIRGLAADSSGNVYVADSDNYRVRKIDTAGEISTLAGTGDEGFSGDGGPATRARLGRICEIAADPLGNVYIAESSGYRIRKIDTSRRISTIAGTGERSTSGDGGPASLATLRDPCRGNRRGPRRERACFQRASDSQDRCIFWRYQYVQELGRLGHLERSARH